MSQKSTIEEYSLEITGRCQAGQARCKRLVGADFASEAPRSLARTLLNIFGYLSRVATAITKSIDWHGSPALTEKATRNLRVLDWNVKQFGSHIRYVESALTDRLPWQVIPSFEKLVELLRPGAQVMLRPMWHYNYATIVSDLRDLYLSELQEFEYYLPEVDVESNIVHTLGSPFHIISFPALERDNILLHSVIGHELGHLVAAQLVEQWKAEFLVGAQSDIETATNEEVAKQGVTPEKEPLLYSQYYATRLTENSTLCLKYWERAIEELLSDVVGAILFGPAALFSTFDIAIQSGFDLRPSERNEYYPPWRTRIREVLGVVTAKTGRLLSVTTDLFRMAAPLSLSKRAESIGLTREARAKIVNDRLTTIREVAADRADEKVINRDPYAKIAYAALRSYIDRGAERITSVLGRRVVNDKQLAERLPILIERLDAGVPPNAENDFPSQRSSKVSLVDVLNSAWYHKASLAIGAESAEDQNLFEHVRSQRNRLTLKAIEFTNLAEEHPPARPTPLGQRRTGSTGGVLTCADIQEFMERSAILDRIIATPLFNAKQSLVDAALDVRLGTEFILFRKEAFSALDMSETESLTANVERYQERVIRRVGDPFVLHPRQLVIGSTLEYIQLPPTLMAYVVGKSTWGRTGLVIATATKIDPGFRGCITLEIINEGEVPLILLPGIPVAQLVFHRTEGPITYSGVYSCPIGPEFPRFESVGADAAFWLPRRNRQL